MGEAEIIIDSQQVIIHSVLYFYGDAANEDLSQQIAADVAQHWNEPGGTIMINKKPYKVVFDVQGHWAPALSPNEVFYNTDPKNNYFRVESFAGTDISFVDGIGSNTGYFKLDNLLNNSTTVKFSATGGPRDLHPIARDEIYRIGYEAIRNACAHSSASELEVSINCAQDLTLRVNDNGCGIDPVISAEGKAGHFGLQGMRERAKRIGSKLMLNSSPNSGTAITLVVPGNIVFRNGSATRFEKIKSFFGLERVSLEKL